MLCTYLTYPLLPAILLTMSADVFALWSGISCPRGARKDYVVFGVILRIVSGVAFAGVQGSGFVS
jgi:hypothetical protein